MSTTAGIDRCQRAAGAARQLGHPGVTARQFEQGAVEVMIFPARAT
jgi:hypothetical protein